MSPIAQKVTVLKWVDANPKSAGMHQGFFDEFSNYGPYERLTDNGLTEILHYSHEELPMETKSERNGEAKT